MKDATFAELLGSVNEALEHAQGQRSLRTTSLPRPLAGLTGRDVRRIRGRLRASQTVFASYLNVSAKLVQAWEAGRRRPDGPALVLLHIVTAQPAIVEAVRRKPVRQAGDRRARAREARHATPA